VQRLLGGQAKLSISEPGDQYEQEADQVAEQVMRMAVPAATGDVSVAIQPPSISRYVRRKATGNIARQLAEEEQGMPQSEEEFSESDLLSLKEQPGARHEMSSDLEAQIQSQHGGGRPLDAELRAFFEPRFSYDFSGVRVHTDSGAAQTAQMLNARAYTLGRDIAFAPGEYQPETPEGRRLLAHELTHVVQQGDGIRTVMRACACSAIGARNPTAAENTFLSGKFPRLVPGDWCVTAPATPTYNCFAWSIGNTSKWIDTEVDSVYGNKNGTLEFSDFDSFYAANGGLSPVTDSTPADPKVVLYGKGSTPTHAARKTSLNCGASFNIAFESKLGTFLRIVHDAYQLEGGSTYGDINRFYE
jgi:hypothetical protein